MSENQQPEEQKATRGKGKVGKEVKDNILAVFTRLGGTAAMAKWAADKPTEFYRAYMSLAPKEQHLSGPDGGPIAHSMTVELVKPESPAT